MKKSDSWDWPLLLYVATVTLKRSEAQFWRMTPRKLNALSKAHIEMNSGGNDSKENSSGAPKATPGFIDQIM